MRDFRLSVVISLCAFWALAKGPLPITVQLKENTTIGNIPLKAGEIKLYQSFGEEKKLTLASGTLAADARIGTLTLKAGTQIFFAENYTSPSAELMADHQIAGIPFAKGTNLRFQYFSKKDPSLASNWGTYLSGTVAQDTQFDTWSRDVRTNPVRQGFKVRKGETIVIWCEEGPCTENSKITWFAGHDLNADETENAIAFKSGDRLFYDLNGKLASALLVTNREIQGQKVRGRKSLDIYVSFYPNGKLKEFLPELNELFGVLVENKRWDTVRLYPDGTPARLPLSSRDQLVRWDFVANGGSQVLFWPSEDSSRAGIVKQMLLGKDDSVGGIPIPRLSLLRCDKKGVIREVLTDRAKDGLRWQQGKLLEFNEKRELINERAVEKPEDSKSKIEGFYDSED